MLLALRSLFEAGASSTSGGSGPPFDRLRRRSQRRHYQQAISTLHAAGLISEDELLVLTRK